MNKKINAYNIRVYGLLINDKSEVLLSSENRKGFQFTKFPGGGLEMGEGTIDCLKREFKEELNLDLFRIKHFYTTDFFQESAFRENEQLIAIYYRVESLSSDSITSGMHAIDEEVGNHHVVHWENIKELSLGKLNFPIDQLVLEKLKKMD